MGRDVRFNRRRAGMAAIAGLAALVALIATASAPASHFGAGSTQAGHPCLVMTGSGDPAFTKNFNPYSSTGLPTGAFVRGAFYEPLIISSVAGGGHTYPWLAQSWKWSNGNKTLTLNLVKNAKWSDGKPLTSADVVYSLTAGKQDKIMDMVGLRVARHEHRVGQMPRPVQGRHQAEDGRLAVHRGEPQPPVRRPEAHLGERHRCCDIHELRPCRLRPLRQSRPLHGAGLRLQQESDVLEGGRAEDPVPRVHAGRVERRSTARHPERPGGLDAQLRPERGRRRTRRRIQSTTTRSTRRRRIPTRSCSTRRSTRTASSPSARR